MGKRIVYTKVTPLPTHIPRQLALDMLHSHGEVISLNPLVTGHKAINAPRDAAADEFFANWYEIMEIITWGFGMKKKISFKGCFHDLPNGLQTHTYAPMGVDLRNKWTVRGNQPGEPREPRELGVETPAEGLYLREDVEIVCNIALSSFVKKEMKAAAGIMVDRMTRKAELLDEGVLHAMFENGRLKTVNPNVQLQAEQAKQETVTLNYRETDIKSPAPSSPGSQRSPQPTPSEFEEKKQFGTYHDLTGNTHRASYLPVYQASDVRKSSHQQAYPGAQEKLNIPPIAEVEGSFIHPSQRQSYQQHQQQPQPSPNAQTFRAELQDTSIPADPTPAPLQPRRTSAQQIPTPQPSPRPYAANRQSSSSQTQQPQSSPPAHQQNFSRNSYQPPYNPSDPNTYTPQSLATNPSTSSPPQQPSSSPAQRHTSPNHQAPPRSNYAVTNPDSAYFQGQNSPSSTYSDNGTQGLAQQVQGLGISERPVSKCPVCGDFEGDEAAVSHHVARHFAS